MVRIVLKEDVSYFVPIVAGGCGTPASPFNVRFVRKLAILVVNAPSLVFLADVTSRDMWQDSVPRSGDLLVPPLMSMIMLLLMMMKIMPFVIFNLLLWMTNLLKLLLRILLSLLKHLWFLLCLCSLK